MKNIFRVLQLLVLIQPAVKAYVYRVDKWQKNDHVVYRFFDNHHATKPSDLQCDKQREEYMQLVESKHGIAIIEDIEYSLPDSRDALLEPGKHVYNWMLSDAEFTELMPRYQTSKFLACLASQCGFRGILHKNIEFRSLMSLALSGLVDIHFNEYLPIVDAVVHQLQQGEMPQPWSDVITALLNKHTYYRHLCAPLLQQLFQSPENITQALAQAQWPEGMSTIIPLFDPWGFTQEGLPTQARYKNIYNINI